MQVYCAAWRVGEFLKARASCEWANWVCFSWEFQQWKNIWNTLQASFLIAEVRGCGCFFCGNHNTNVHPHLSFLRLRTHIGLDRRLWREFLSTTEASGANWGTPGQEERPLCRTDHSFTPQTISVSIESHENLKSYVVVPGMWKSSFISCQTYQKYLCNHSQILMQTLCANLH